MKQGIGFTLIIIGALVAGGSANDCDGACMDQANDLGTMLLVSAVGIVTMLIGAFVGFSTKD